ncbi:glycine betaine ABC transporter substrate-binding protein [Desertibacillus haloalkaliphilus]|nr:glycine betaine ABC transporter substrate-binding protein [Desertibacillus haloalkaliphilus]
MMYKKRSFLLCIVIVSVLISSGCGPADTDEQDGEVAESDNPTITLGQVPYQQAWVPLAIIENVANELGYPTERTEGDVGVMFLGLSRGDIDVYADIWLPNLHSTYADRYEDTIDLIGTLYEDAPVGWAVPTYVDIDSIEDLSGNEELFGGEVIGIEPGAGMMPTSEEVLEEYDLDLNLISGSTEAMLAAVLRATNNEEPVVFLAWRPHTMFQLFDIKMLDDPRGIWETDDVMTGVNENFQEKAPDLYSFLEDFEISLEDVEDLMLRMEDEDLNMIAQEWIDENRSQIEEWIDG